jgi:transposase-like protein
MNPIWITSIIASFKRVKRKCPLCGRTDVYFQKKVGQFYACKHCGEKFKEKEK